MRRRKRRLVFPLQPLVDKISRCYYLRMNTSSVKIGVVIGCLVILALACSLPTGAAENSTPTRAPSLTPRSTETIAPQPETPTEVPPTLAPQPSETPEPSLGEVSIFLIALEDSGAGIPVGCGDSLVEVKRTVEIKDGAVQAALEELFALKTQQDGESGLFTALYQSNLQVESVNIGTDGVARVALTGEYLLGGVCDNPRFQGQIEQTILVNSGADSVAVTINGQALEELLSSQ